MSDPLAVAVAFCALGANVLGSGLLLLLNPRSTSVRWNVAFLTAISLWLAGSGVIAMGSTADAWPVVLATGVQLMPALFLAAALVNARIGPSWLPAAVALTGLLMLPVTVPLVAEPGAIGIAWHTAGWGLGSWLHVRSTKHDIARYPQRASGSRLLMGLLAIPPVLAAVGIALGADDFFTYVMPLMIIGVHFAIFGGVVWLRFYDIEVRAARSGEIAGRMAETERLAAVGELSASVAHEVRNPLAGIRSLAQRLAEEDVDPDRARRYAGVIVEETSRLDRIVGDLLALARRRADGVEVEADAATPLATLFDDLTLLVASRAEQAGVRLVMRANDLAAPAPRAPLGQALLNLILNAIRHSPAGGTVGVEAECTAPRGEIVIAVRDEGPGVPAEERERIFKPFHSGGTDGTGLGLSVVRHLARELGWNVEVRDAPEGGAEFRLTIRPASRSAERPSSRVEEMP